MLKERVKAMSVVGHVGTNSKTCTKTQQDYETSRIPAQFLLEHLDVPQLNSIVAMVDEVHDGGDSQGQRHDSKEHPPSTCAYYLLTLWWLRKTRG